MRTLGQAFKKLHKLLILVLLLAQTEPLSAAPGTGKSLTILATDYPPFEMEVPVEGLSGFDYEVVIEAFARTGWNAKIVFVPWKRAVAEARAGNAAGLLSCAYRAQREEFFLYSDQLSSSTDGVYYRREFAADPISTHTDLIGKKVGAVTGYSTYAKLTDFGIEPIDIPNDEAGIRMLEVGRLNFFLNGRQATDFLIKLLGLSGRFDFAVIADKPLFLCLSKSFPNSEGLLLDFNKGLAEVKADGTYAFIHAKYQ